MDVSSADVVADEVDSVVPSVSLDSVVDSMVLPLVTVVCWVVDSPESSVELLGAVVVGIAQSLAG